MVKSADRVIDLMELIAAASEPLGVNEIARRLSIPKSSASALLATLRRRGYVEQDASEKYTLNSALTAGWVGGIVPQLKRVAHPVMVDLVARSGETAFCGVLTKNWQVQVIHKVVSPSNVRYDADISTPRAPHSISLGRVLLAFAPARDLERFLESSSFQALSDRKQTSAASLRKDLVQVRKVGYAVSVDARIVGASGVAAPVRDPRGGIVAALNMSAPTARFHRVRKEMIECAISGAEQISRLLEVAPLEGFQ